MSHVCMRAGVCVICVYVFTRARERACVYCVQVCLLCADRVY